MNSDLITPTPFTISVVVEKFCDEIYCGSGNQELVISNFFPVVIGIVLFIPVFVVLLKLLLSGKKKEPVLLEKRAESSNVLILLLLSIVIAAIMFGIYFYL